MKKYLVILVLLAFTQAQAQSHYPKIHLDTLRSVSYPSDSIAIVTIKKVMTTIESEIKVPYHGMIVTSATKVVIDTSLLSINSVKISRDVRRKALAPYVIENYLLYGKQSIGSENTISILYGPFVTQHFFYLKNSVLFEETKHAKGWSGFARGSSALLFLVIVLLDWFSFETAQDMLQWKSAVWGIGLWIICIITIFNTHISHWDELIVPFVAPTLVYLIIMVIKMLREIYFKNNDTLHPAGGGGGGNA